MRSAPSGSLSPGTVLAGLLFPARSWSGGRGGTHCAFPATHPRRAGSGASSPPAATAPPWGLSLGMLNLCVQSLLHGPPYYGLLSVSQSHGRRVGEGACRFVPGDLPQPCPPTASHPAPFVPAHRPLSLLLDGAAVSPSLSQNIPHSSLSL